MDIDFIVVGGGIVGLSTAMHLLETRPGASLLVVEKENRIAAHQSSHNSGVIHSGIYYKPETLKAKFCRDGVERIIQFCRRHDVAFEQRGKLLVATDADEKRRM